MAPTTSTLSDLWFEAGSPPPQWLESCPDIESKARVLCLWESTMSLIHNESFLSQDPDRYMAMILDHWVSVHEGPQQTPGNLRKPFQRAFTSISGGSDNTLKHVTETKYLHSKLAAHGGLSQTFRPSGFRSLKPPSKQEEEAMRKAAHPLAMVLNQDAELLNLLKRLLAVRREINEVEIARNAMDLHMYRVMTLPETPP